MSHQKQNTAASAESEPLTLAKLKESFCLMAKEPTLIAIVCRPGFADSLRDIGTLEAESLGLFGASPVLGVDIIRDADQSEEWIAFHDREKLRAYLARNRKCNDCGALGARWFNHDAETSHCESCAAKINSTVLPGIYPPCIKL